MASAFPIFYSIWASKVFFRSQTTFVLFFLEITALIYRHTPLSDELIYDTGNDLALVLYDYDEVAIAACIDVVMSLAASFIEGDELEKKGSNSEELKRIGRKNIRRLQVWAG